MVQFVERIVSCDALAIRYRFAWLYHRLIPSVELLCEGCLFCAFNIECPVLMVYTIVNDTVGNEFNAEVIRE